MSYYVLFPLFFFPPVIHMSVIFSRFSSLPLSYLLLCIRIFYVFDTRMIRYWRNLLFHCDRPWILCNLFTFRAMLLNILELWNMTRLRFALLHAATLYYFTLGGSLRCQHNVARTRKWYGVLWEASKVVSIQTSYQRPVSVGREPRRPFLFCSKDPGSVSPHSPT